MGIRLTQLSTGLKVEAELGKIHYSPSCDLHFSDGDLSLSRRELQAERKRLAATETAFTLLDSNK